ncbi:MAG: hypothetical protein KAJ52_00220 [Sedimentisphaerales bacterium]|nr:hypothetical protein [Sedimentisphaerales bacterium]
MSEIFERITIFTTKPVIGQYRFKDKLQIYPSKRKPIQDGRFFFPLTIEISFPQQGEDYYRYAIPSYRSPLTKQIVEIQHLLSVVTQFFFFDHIKVKKPIKKFTNKSCKLIEKGNIEYYQDKVFDDRRVANFLIPEFMDSILETYYALPTDILLAFRKACYLFYCGVELRGTYHSLSFASFVSAIETLMAFDAEDTERCECCGQPKYRLNARFREFIYAFGYGGNKSPVAKKFINKLYEHRSKILHEGQLLLGDMFWHHVEEKNNDIREWEESFLHKDLLGATRICLIRWVASQGEG